MCCLFKLSQSFKYLVYLMGITNSLTLRLRNYCYVSHIQGEKHFSRKMLISLDVIILTVRVLTMWPKLNEDFTVWFKFNRLTENNPLWARLQMPFPHHRISCCLIVKRMGKTLFTYMLNPRIFAYAHPKEY